MRVRLTVTRRMYRPVALRPLWRTQEPASSPPRCCWPAAAWARPATRLPSTAHRSRATSGAVTVREVAGQERRRRSARSCAASPAARAGSTAWRRATAPRSTAATACGPTSPPASARTPAVVGSFPEPFLHGIDGKRLPVRIECADARGPACRQVGDRLAAYEIPAARGGLQTARAPETLRVLVGPWTALRLDPAVNALEHGPRASGVYARDRARRAHDRGARRADGRVTQDARRRQRPRGRHQAPRRPADVGRDRHRRRRRRVGRPGLRGGHARHTGSRSPSARPAGRAARRGLTGGGRDRVGCAPS